MSSMNHELFHNTHKSAIFNKAGTHRYMLKRIWDENKPIVCFIGLNPSTADRDNDDPTIAKVKRIAKYNNFGGIYMLNLFSFVTSEPSELQYDMQAQKVNDCHIRFWTMYKKVVFCWGNFKQSTIRGQEVAALFQREAYCLAHNKNGSPKHPLYCLDKSELIKYHPAKNAVERIA